MEKMAPGASPRQCVGLSANMGIWNDVDLLRGCQLSRQLSSTE